VAEARVKDDAIIAGTVPDTLEGQVRLLLAEREIKRVLMRYARAADRYDLDLMRSCYWPEGTDSHGAFYGNVDEFIAWVGTQIERFERTVHQLTNMFVEIDSSGDVARVESYVLAYHRFDEAGTTMDMLLGLRYVDRFECRDGEWRIAERVCTYDWRHAAPNPGQEGFTDKHPRSSRAGDDPLYHILSGDAHLAENRAG
jgi:hypothetical protein